MSDQFSEYYNYYKAVTLTVEEGSKSLRTCLRKCLSDENILSLQQFLLHHFHDLFFAYSQKNVCTCGETGQSASRQSFRTVYWQILYRGVLHDESRCQYVPREDIDIDNLDISLCAILLKKFWSNTSSNISSAIKEIKDTRDRLSHLDSVKLEESDYRGTWVRIEHAVLTITKELDRERYRNVQTDIQRIKVRFIDDAECRRFLDLVRGICEFDVSSILSHFERAWKEQMIAVTEGLKMHITVLMSERRNGELQTKEDNESITLGIASEMKEALRSNIRLYLNFLSQAQSIEDWRIANEIFGNALRLFQSLKNMDMNPVDVVHRSIELTMQCSSVESFDFFMQRYQDGEVQGLVQNTLITDEFLKLHRLKRVELHVEITPEGCSSYRKKIHEEQGAQVALPGRECETEAVYGTSEQELQFSLEKAKESLEIFRSLTRERKQRKTILVLGEQGVGKSSFINTSMMAITGKYQAFARAGMRGGYASNVTIHLRRYTPEEYCKGIHIYNDEERRHLPVFIDVIGFDETMCLRLVKETDTKEGKEFYSLVDRKPIESSVNRIMLQFLLRGRIPELCNLLDFGNLLLDGKLEEMEALPSLEEKADYRPDAVVMIIPGNTKELPQKLIKTIRHETKAKKIVVPLFGIMTKVDLVHFDPNLAVIQDDFKNHLGITGDFFVPLVNYVHDGSLLDELPKSNPHTDIPVLEMLTQIYKSETEEIKSITEELRQVKERKEKAHKEKTDSSKEKATENRTYLIVNGIFCIIVFFLLLIFLYKNVQTVEPPANHSKEEL